jgi:hypothetical protein
VFGLRKKKDSGAAIVEFWRWWAEARHRVAAAIDDGSTPRLVTEIAGKVHAIHRELDWELAPGRAAEHALVVAPGGNAALRAVVARWLAAAPPVDKTFEYHGSRQADDSMFEAHLEVAGQKLDMSELRFAFTVDDDAHDIDVSVWHPAFPELPEEARLQLTFLALDWALGEEQVELWVGAVEPLTAAVPRLRRVADLRAAVAKVAARHADPVYVMLGADTDLGPLIATVQVPLRSARWPRFDTHVELVVPYQAQDDGLPTEGSLALLRDLEDRVELAVSLDGMVVAHETTNAVRTFHVYVDGTTGAADAAVAAAAAGPLTATAEVTYDPGLERVSHLRP